MINRIGHLTSRVNAVSCLIILRILIEWLGACVRMMPGYQSVIRACEYDAVSIKDDDMTANAHVRSPSATSSNIRAPDQKVNCETCGKTYASKKSLKIHIRTHTGYKPYACHMCPKRFAQTNVLKAHINAHTGRRDWVCQYCKKAFTQSAHLRTHEKIHLHRRDYVCGYCKQSFGSKGVRDRHIRQHTGEKPYKCSQCPKSFTRGESLKFHENAHQGIRPYQCQHGGCSSTFTKQSSLKRHITTCHGGPSVPITSRPHPPPTAHAHLQLYSVTPTRTSMTAAVSAAAPFYPPPCDVPTKVEELEPDAYPCYYGYVGANQDSVHAHPMHLPTGANQEMSDYQKWGYGRMMCKQETWTAYSSGPERIYAQDPFTEYGNYTEAWNLQQRPHYP